MLQSDLWTYITGLIPHFWCGYYTYTPLPPKLWKLAFSPLHSFNPCCESNLAHLWQTQQAPFLLCTFDHIIRTRDRWNKALLTISDVSLSLVVSKCQSHCVGKSIFFSPSVIQTRYICSQISESGGLWVERGVWASSPFFVMNWVKIKGMWTEITALLLRFYEDRCEKILGSNGCTLAMKAWWLMV